MNAETLRRAAALMRERAQAIPDGPWEKEFSDVIRTDVPFGEEGYLLAECPTVERAAHIASWHPAVALAVADLLEQVAPHLGILPRPDQDALLAVAHTYLGEEGAS